MKLSKKLSMIVVSLMTVAMFFGCETDSASQAALSISPNNKTINEGQSVALTANGGFGEYRWALSSKTYGTLSQTRGQSVVYTATQGGDVRQTITVYATSTSTNSTSALSATAVILQRGGTTDSTDSTSKVTLSISPNNKTIDNGETIKLTASNGFEKYRWYLADDSLGDLIKTSGQSVEYKATKGGKVEQFVTVLAFTNSTHASATAMIIQN